MCRQIILLMIGLVCLVINGESQTLANLYKAKVKESIRSVQPNRQVNSNSWSRIWDRFPEDRPLSKGEIQKLADDLGLQDFFDNGDLNYWYKARLNAKILMLEFAAKAAVIEKFGKEKASEMEPGELDAIAEISQLAPEILAMLNREGYKFPTSFYFVPKGVQELETIITKQLKFFQYQEGNINKYTGPIKVWTSDVYRSVSRLRSCTNIMGNTVQSVEDAKEIVQYFELDKVSLPNINLVWLPGDYAAINNGKNYVGGETQKLIRDCAAFRLMLDSLQRQSLEVNKSDSNSLFKAFLQLIDNHS